MFELKQMDESCLAFTLPYHGVLGKSNKWKMKKANSGKEEVRKKD